MAQSAYYSLRDYLRMHGNALSYIYQTINLKAARKHLSTQHM